MVAANLVAGGAATLCNPADAERLPKLPTAPRDIVADAISGLFRPLKSIAAAFGKDENE
jgi:hypothetical protein